MKGAGFKIFLFSDGLLYDLSTKSLNPSKPCVFKALQHFCFTRRRYGCPPGIRTPISRSRICCPTVERGGNWVKLRNGSFDSMGGAVYRQSLLGSVQLSHQPS